MQTHGVLPFLAVLPYPLVCDVCLCVSHFTSRRGAGEAGCTNVGRKDLIRYYYHSYGTKFLCWRSSFGEDGKNPTY